MQLIPLRLGGGSEPGSSFGGGTGGSSFGLDALVGLYKFANPVDP
jgi:hypothetical protein